MEILFSFKIVNKNAQNKSEIDTEICLVLGKFYNKVVVEFIKKKREKKQKFERTWKEANFKILKETIVEIFLNIIFIQGESFF